MKCNLYYGIQKAGRYFVRIEVCFRKLTEILIVFKEMAMTKNCIKGHIRIDGYGDGLRVVFLLYTSCNAWVPHLCYFHCVTRNVPYSINEASCIRFVLDINENNKSFISQDGQITAI